ncbi:MAG: hypothetical protein N3I35_13270 [Clostridia bacterium]|nr:hypothetical protein [Clostridia bacterium]
MLGLLLDIGNGVLVNMLQVLAGCVLSVLIYKIITKKKIKAKNPVAVDFLMITLLSACGMLFPLGIYGIVPVFAVMVLSGINTYFTVPLVISNLLFNMLDPVLEKTFVWRASGGRILLAFVAGVLAGMIIRMLDSRNVNIINHRMMSRLIPREQGRTLKLGAIPDVIGIIGPFVIIGAVLNGIFHRYMYNDVMNAFYASSIGTEITEVLLKNNATISSTFSLSLGIANVFMNFAEMSALFILFKPRGIFIFIAYYSVIALICAASIFVF